MVWSIKLSNEILNLIGVYPYSCITRLERRSSVSEADKLGLASLSFEGDGLRWYNGEIEKELKN